MKRRGLYLSLLVTGITIWAGLIWLCKQPGFSRIKTNKLHCIITKRDHLYTSFFEAMKLYFWRYYPATWSRGIMPTRQEIKAQRRFFGSNLCIEHIIDHDQAIVKNRKRPTLFLHGWGDTKASARLLKAYCDVIPGDMITFNFRDRGVLFPKVQHSSLGQLYDVLQALYTLDWIDTHLKPEAVDLFGYSRGGATAVNMIAVLHDTSGTYDKDLDRIGIDSAKRTKLLKLIQNGCIVLNCPLRDLNVCADNKFHSFAKQALKALAWVSHYKLDGMQAIDMARTLSGLKLKTLLHFQYNDRVVPNKGEAEFYTALAQHNPYSTFLVLGNDGGHMHTHRALSQTVHIFKKMYGGSYDPAYVDQYHLLKQQYKHANKLLRPGALAAQCIEEYYESCKPFSIVQR